MQKNVNYSAKDDKVEYSNYVVVPPFESFAIVLISNSKSNLRL